MKTVLTIAASIAALASATEGAAQPAAGASQICATEGAVKFLCGPSRPEDLVHIPRTDWIVSSSMDGGLHLIDVTKKTSSQLYPSPAARDRFDKSELPDMPGAAGRRRKSILFDHRDLDASRQGWRAHAVCDPLPDRIARSRVRARRHQ